MNKGVMGVPTVPVCEPGLATVIPGPGAKVSRCIRYRDRVTGGVLVAAGVDLRAGHVAATAIARQHREHICVGPVGRCQLRIAAVASRCLPISGAQSSVGRVSVRPPAIREFYDPYRRVGAVVVRGERRSFGGCRCRQRCVCSLTIANAPDPAESNERTGLPAEFQYAELPHSGLMNSTVTR